MGRYLFTVGYTADSWANQIQARGNVLERIQPLLDRTQGRVDSCFYTFGEDDLILIAEFPSPKEAAAFSLAATAGGAIRSIRTTTLLTVEEGLDAMQRAEEASRGYEPPVRQPATSGQAKGGQARP
jgi:uncharacterized protein with GYD domain